MAELARLLSEALAANQAGNSDEVHRLLVEAKRAMVAQAAEQAARID
jgi:hypothetical protein